MAAKDFSDSTSGVPTGGVATPPPVEGDPTRPAETPPAEPTKEAPAETPPAGDKKPEGEGDAVARGFAALARKEAEFVDKSKDLKGREERVSKFEAALENGKGNPVAVMEAFGISRNDLLNFLAKEGTPAATDDQDSPMAKRLAALEQQIKDRDAKATKAQEEQRAIEIERQDIATIGERATGAPDKYKLIKARGESAAREVRELYYEAKEKYGRAPSLEAVMDEVEKFLRTQVEKDAAELGFTKAQAAASTGNGGSGGLSQETANEIPAKTSNGTQDKYPLDPGERTRAIMKDMGLLNA